MVALWTWLNGKKTVIGALLDLLSTGLLALVGWLPQFGDLLTQLGVSPTWVAAALAVVGKGAMVVGLIHKVWKTNFGSAAGFGRTGVAAFLALVTSGMLAISCAGVKAPPNYTPTMKTQWYAGKLADAISTVQQVAISGERAGLFQRADVAKVGAATEKAGEAILALNKALDAGEAQTTAKAKAIVAIRSALGELPALLSPDAAKAIAPYVQVALTLLTAFASNDMPAHLASADVFAFAA